MYSVCVFTYLSLPIVWILDQAQPLSQEKSTLGGCQNNYFEEKILDKLTCMDHIYVEISNEVGVCVLE